MSRRTVLAAAPFVAGAGSAGFARGPADALFTLGIASGDPAPDGMVLWTRLAPAPLEPDGGMGRGRVAVRWEVAEDEGFARIVRRGEALATPDDGHSVHVEVAGLRPGRPYFYRFLSGGQASATGRTRTAPAPGSHVERLRLCYGSCQRYDVGYYAGWHHVVAEEPELILFLGDYIYEYARGTYPEVASAVPGRVIEPVGETIPSTFSPMWCATACTRTTAPEPGPRACSGGRSASTCRRIRRPTS